MSTKTGVFLDRHTPPTMFSLIVITGVAALTMNMFLPALPLMAADFNTDYAVIQLSVGLYLACMGASQLIIGPLADRYGRRNVLIGAYAIFTIASLICALATDLSYFMAARMCQATVFAGVVLSRAMIRDSYSEAESASKIGYVTMGMAIAPMVGPAFGGWLGDLFGWRANFWAMAAFGILALLLIWRDLGETQREGFRNFREQFKAYPVLLSSKYFWAYSLSMACAAGTFFAYLGGAPFVGTHIFELTPSQLGLLFGATSLGYASGSFLSGRLSSRTGVRRMIFWGTLTTVLALSLSLSLFLLGLGTMASFFGLMTAMGTGYGMTMPNATVGALSVVPKLSGTASGLSGAIMICLGAGISAFAGAAMVPGVGPERLLEIQLTLALTGLAIAYWIRQSAPRPSA